jgi:hypothetical protein
MTIVVALQIGGITSHEVAEYGLHAKSAQVLGQIDYGVPLWRITGSGTIYVVFPGNVGTEQSLCDVAHKLGLQYKASSNEDIVTKQPVSSHMSNSGLYRTLSDLYQKKQAIAAFNICKTSPLHHNVDVSHSSYRHCFLL